MKFSAKSKFSAKTNASSLSSASATLQVFLESATMILLKDSLLIKNTTVQSPQILAVSLQIASF